MALSSKKMLEAEPRTQKSLPSVSSYTLGPGIDLNKETVLPLLFSWNDKKDLTPQLHPGLPPILAHTRSYTVQLLASTLHPFSFCLACPLSSTKQIQKPEKPSNSSSPQGDAHQKGPARPNLIRCLGAQGLWNGAGRDFRTGRMRKGSIAFSEEEHHSWGRGTCKWQCGL